MLSTKSGATFNLETPNMTFAVRKDVIEIVYRIKTGVFQIVNFSRIDAGRGMLFMNWGDYFRRLSNEKAQMPKLQKHCPILYDILVGEDKDGIKEMDFGRSEEEFEHGFGVEVKISGQLPLQKAVGWMLREAGKRDEDRIRRYIGQNGSRMPRTMLRYAIEKFPLEERSAILNAY